MNISTVAADGLRRMAATSDYESGRSAGANALRGLQGVSGVERDVVDCALSATKRTLANESAYKAQEAALQVLAAGVSGPVGQVLARVGFTALDRAIDWEDGRHMGPSYLSTIAARGTPTEVAVAGAAEYMSGASLTDESGCKTQMAALKMLRDGTASSPEAAVARLGREAYNGATDYEDARALGGRALERIPGDLASVARSAAANSLTNESAAKAELAACQLIEKGSNSLGALGHAAYQGATDYEDARALGSTILEGIARTPDATAAALAAAARSISSRHLYNESAAKAQDIAFQMLAGGLSGDKADVLARLGSAAMRNAGDKEDARTLGVAMLGELAKHGADAFSQARARNTAKIAEELTWHSAAIAVVQRELQAVLDGETLPSARPSAKVSGKPEDIAVLEKRIAENSSVQQAVEDAVKKQAPELAQAQAQVGTLAGKINPLVERDHHLVKWIRYSGYGVLGGAALLVGGFSLASHLGAVGTGLLMGSGALLGTSVLVNVKSKADHGRVYQQYETLCEAYDLASGTADYLKFIVQQGAEISQHAEAAIKADRGQLDVLKMADTVNKSPTEPGKIDVGSGDVTIGKLKLPRKQPLPPEPQPESKASRSNEKASAQ